MKFVDSRLVKIRVFSDHRFAPRFRGYTAQIGNGFRLFIETKNWGGPKINEKNQQVSTSELSK